MEREDKTGERPPASESWIRLSKEMHSNSIRLLVFLLIQLLVSLLRFQTTVSFITAVRFYFGMPVLVINRLHI